MNNISEILGKMVKKQLTNKEVTKTNLHSISNTTLRNLNKTVRTNERIPERKNWSSPHLHNPFGKLIF